ncbi:type II secretion system protein [Methylophilus aquaticus]|uniref:Type II secretion system protein n=1 Tax=Methylophilus aquaticus TaxID=1971610 RepID=A0ABT9JVN5_9PROT|nr:type II secretion system protein [Methylophilus aquaticus]MDP8568196.1 type II secretion system protein [Methylophilus aquaticus]
MRTGRVCDLAAAAHRQDGFSYIGVLITLAIAAIGMTGATMLWQHQAQRINEALLLETGEAYRLAIGRYYEASPGPVKQYPQSLDVLLEDRRFPLAKRHLRRILPDPFYPRRPIGVIQRDGRIVGVFSQSELAPIRKSGYQEFQESFKNAKHYKQWQFIYEPNTLTTLEDSLFN